MRTHSGPWGGVVVLLAGVGVSLAGTHDSALATLDRGVHELVRRNRRASWRPAAHAVSALGETPVAITAVVLFSVRRPRAGVRDLAVLLTALAARHAVCRLIARPRPDRRDWWSRPTGFSTPSRHTMTAVLAASLIADRAPARRPGAASARAVGVAVAGSRVVLGVHWASDTVAGYLVGAGIHRLTRDIGMRDA